MTTFADPRRCPDCRGALDLGAPRCSTCGLVLSGSLGRDLFVVLTRADQLLREMRSASELAAPPPTTPPTTTMPPTTTPLTTTPRRGDRLRGASVPQILLALGAVCLLVAALVFLAVTWSIMGVGGRTSTLVVLTLVAGALTRWLAGRGLRGAVEALGLVTLGLAALDVVGAANAGWLGDLSTATFTAVLGALLTAGGLVATHRLSRTTVRGFLGGEITAVLGSAVMSWGIATGAAGGTGTRHLLAVLVTTAVAAVEWRLIRPGEAVFTAALRGGCLVVGVTWLTLLGVGLDSIESNPTFGSVWGQLEGGWLLAAAVVALALGAWRPVHLGLRVTAVGAGLVPLGMVITLPAYDESVTVATTTLLVGVVLVGAAIAV